jgi:hypothetical protein
VPDAAVEPLGDALDVLLVEPAVLPVVLVLLVLPGDVLVPLELMLESTR